MEINTVTKTKTVVASDVACPVAHCRAHVNQRCINMSGRVVEDHPARLAAAHAKAVR